MHVLARSLHLAALLALLLLPLTVATAPAGAHAIAAYSLPASTLAAAPDCPCSRCAGDHAAPCTSACTAHFGLPFVQSDQPRPAPQGSLVVAPEAARLGAQSDRLFRPPRQHMHG